LNLSVDQRLNGLEPSERLTAEDVLAMVDDLGDMRIVLDRAEHGELAELYRALRLAVSYDHRERMADVSISPAPLVEKVRVRGGTRTLTTRLELNV
jgi:hypothetical protein